MAYLANLKVDNGTLKVYKDGLVVSTTSQLNYTPTVNTIGYWPLNGDGLDYSGNEKNLSFVGPTSFISNNKFSGKMIYFNGVNNTTTCYAISPNISMSQNSCTVSCWINPTSSYGIFFNSAGNAGEIGFWVGMNDGGPLGGHLGSCGDWFWGTDLSISASQWTHVVMTRDSSHVVYYKNGVSGTTYEGTCGAVLNFPITLGGVQDIQGTGYRAYNGYMTEAIVEDVYWDAAKVAAYYSARI